MSRRMTGAEAREWMARWELVAERQRRELRLESFEERFKALAFLMASTSLFDLRRLDEEDALVRTRWARLQSLARTR